MRYWNADGGRRALCINGTRCAARLALDLGWARRPRCWSRPTPAPSRRAPSRRPRSRSSCRRPRSCPEARRSRSAAAAYEGWFVTVGVPHLVLVWPESLAARAGRRARRGAARATPSSRPGGTNVDFVRFPTPHRMEIRSFERGVEAETLACGTGVLAAVAVGLAARPRQAAGHRPHPRRLRARGRRPDASTPRRATGRSPATPASSPASSSPPRPGLPPPPAPRWSDDPRTLLC